MIELSLEATVVVAAQLERYPIELGGGVATESLLEAVVVVVAQLNSSDIRT